MTAPSATIVVPAYNLARYLPACLDSVRRQSLAAWEAVVVDDGSTDGTAGIVAAIDDARVRLLRQDNAGVSTARNAGLAAARGDAVMFLDGDDLLHPTALERLLAGLTASPQAVATFGALWKILDDGTEFPGQKPLSRHSYPSGQVLRTMIRQNFLANGGQALVRTAAARAAGGFDARLRLSEDWEFWCRLAAQGEFRYIGAPPEVFRLRVRPGSASGGLATTWENHLPALRAVLGNDTLRRRFPPRGWAQLARHCEASHLWEAGRVNFTLRRFGPARRLMLAALWRDPTPKRLALFGLAQASQVLRRPLASRLRFVDAPV